MAVKISHKNMPHVHVTCAIIERNGHVLAAQRSSNMKLPLKWEFPGGKIESDEEAKACLQREILMSSIDCNDFLKSKVVPAINITFWHSMKLPAGSVQPPAGHWWINNIS